VPTQPTTISCLKQAIKHTNHVVFVSAEYHHYKLIPQTQIENKRQHTHFNNAFHQAPNFKTHILSILVPSSPNNNQIDQNSPNFTTSHKTEQPNQLYLTHLDNFNIPTLISQHQLFVLCEKSHVYTHNNIQNKNNMQVVRF